MGLGYGLRFSHRPLGTSGRRCNSEKHPHRANFSTLGAMIHHPALQGLSRQTGHGFAPIQPATAGLGLPRSGRWPVPRRRSWSRSVSAEPDVLRPKSRPESARVNSAARDASSTELMAPACRPTRSPTILMPRARSSVERRPTSVRSASISRWLSRPRGRAQRRRKHHLGLGVRSTMARHTLE